MMIEKSIIILWLAELVALMLILFFIIMDLFKSKCKYHKVCDCYDPNSQTCNDQRGTYAEDINCGKYKDFMKK